METWLDFIAFIAGVAAFAAGLAWLMSRWFKRRYNQGVWFVRETFRRQDYVGYGREAKYPPTPSRVLYQARVSYPHRAYLSRTQCARSKPTRGPSWDDRRDSLL